MLKKPALHRVLLIATSLTVAGAAVYASLSVLPLRASVGAPQPAYAYDAVGAAEFARDGTAPVFIFDQDFYPHQCGKAALSRDGGAVITPYGSDACRTALRGAALTSVEQASIRLLWALIPAAERDAIGAQGRELAGSIGASLKDAVNSQYFNRVYRPEITDILRQALRRAWDRPQVQRAFGQAIRALDPALLDRLVDGIMPIAFEKAEATLWESVAAMANSMLGKPSPENTGTPVARALRAVFEDPRVHDQILTVLPNMATDPAMSRFAGQFASEIGLALVSDPRVPVLASSLLTDPQLSGDATGMGVKTGILARSVPQWLLRYRHPKDHNPLVSYVVRGLVRGDGAAVILVLDEAQLDFARSQGLPQGILLQGNPS
ncbi:MAG: hypothetical protein KJ904_06860 [Alphaproteobacteria bacterium]|nr:hypothetical protein [Alphaproteobacteria bacterium]MBU0797364.1 hypothetical protein [Alphaproteobacteria bacterium]MBU0886868.1 hypothetical protein [Alphaproteobacteria bacterium]MBU1812389.1 hypothetical protein [Alphaproteobacteria bacterium]